MRAKRARLVGWIAAALPAWVAAATWGLHARAHAQDSGAVWKDGNWVAIPAPGKGSPAAEVELIRQDMAKKWNRTAVSDAEKFLKKYGGDPYAEEVMMLAGRAEMARGRYYQAYEWFQRQIDQFPNGPRFDQALQYEYDCADAFLSGRKRIVWGVFYLPAQDDAIQIILPRIVERAPGHPLAEKALLRIADHHYKEQEYPDAVRAYDRYLEVFGRSEKASYAMLQAARASLANYRGPEYDETPLLEARQRYQMFSQRFPLQAERADVPRILEQIRLSLARKAWTTAEFYERIGRKDAARFYYRLVVAQYPQTEWEAKSAAALRRLGEPTAIPAAGGAERPVAGGAEAPKADSAPATMPASAPAAASAP